MSEHRLPGWARTLVVVAHPDDESFGLGAVLDALVRAGSAVHVLSLTHGEASQLGLSLADLGRVRAVELAEAGRRLGVATSVRRHPDAGLAALDPAVLVADVAAAIADHRPDGLLVLDPSGVTGHADHVAATAAALRAAETAGLPVLAWTLPEEVAERLNAELGTAFRGHPSPDVDIELPVDRSTQLAAVAAHATQAVPSSALWRRLELLGDRETLRWLRRPAGQPPRTAP